MTLNVTAARCLLVFAGFCLLLLLSATFVQAQGLQSGLVTGIVSSEDGLPLPGVSIVASSPAMQDQREAMTDANGVYSLRSLPPGAYTVHFVIAGFQSATRADVVVGVGATTDVHAVLPVATRTEVVTVTAESPDVLATPTTGRNFAKPAIDALPVGRRPT